MLTLSPIRRVLHIFLCLRQSVLTETLLIKYIAKKQQLQNYSV